MLSKHSKKFYQLFENKICRPHLIQHKLYYRTHGIIESAVIGADETGIRINGTSAWVHTARTDSLTHLTSHTNRGRSAFDAIGILNQYKGNLVRDGWFSYKQFEQCQHSLCNAHLLRNLVCIGEAEPIHKEWTEASTASLISIKEAVDASRSNSQAELESSLQTVFLDRYDKLTAQAEEPCAARRRRKPD